MNYTSLYKLNYQFFEGKTGYKMMGWSKDEEALNVDYDINIQVSKLANEQDATVSLYAVWKKSDEIKYYVNIFFEDRSYVFTPTYSISENNKFMGTYLEEVVAFDGNIPTFDHFTFNESKSNISGVITVSPELILNLYYDRNSYQVTFDGNGGTYVSGLNTISVKFDDRFWSTRIPRYVREGYHINYHQFIEINIEKDMVIEIPWEPNQYSIVFDGNGATNHVNMDNQLINYDDKVKLIKNLYTKDGYEFIGWSTSKDGEVVYQDQDEILNLTAKDYNTINLFAIFKARTDIPYKIEFYFENLHDDDYTYDTSRTLNLEGETDQTVKALNFIPTIEHYVYNSNKSNDSGVLLPDGSLVLKIYFDVERFTVNFNFQKGSLSEGKQSQSIKYQGAATAPITIRSGYIFVGWDQTFDNVTSNITVNAMWTPKDDTKYSVKYYFEDSISNNYYVDNSKTITREGTTESLVKVNEDDIIEFEHFTFNPEKSSLEGKVSANGSMVLSIYYQRIRVNVSFVVNEGTYIKGDLEQQVKYQGTATPPTYTKNGYLLSWDQKISNIVEDVTIEAVWTPITYEIHFMTYNGSGEMEVIEATYDSPLTLPKNNFTRVGYIFNGWVYDSKTYSDQSSVMNLTDVNLSTVELNASWKGKSFRLQFYASGAYLSKTYMYVTYGSTYELPSANKSGSWMIGWYKDSQYIPQYGRWSLDAPNNSEMSLIAKLASPSITYLDDKKFTNVSGYINYRDGMYISAAAITIKGGQSVRLEFNYNGRGIEEIRYGYAEAGSTAYYSTQHMSSGSSWSYYGGNNKDYTVYVFVFSNDRSSTVSIKRVYN